jgi:hypothetical protein
MIAVHQIADYPELEAELARTPINNRIGPLVLMGNGLPPTDQQCRYHFRRIAQAAGIPDSVCMMHTRAGAVTEAYESGATAEEAMALANTEEETNRGYLREPAVTARGAQACRVAEARHPRDCKSMERWLKSLSTFVTGEKSGATSGGRRSPFFDLGRRALLALKTLDQPDVPDVMVKEAAKDLANFTAAYAAHVASKGA